MKCFCCILCLLLSNTRNDRPSAGLIMYAWRLYAEPPSPPTGSFAQQEEDWLKVVEETVMAAIDTAGSHVEDWGAEFSEDLLLGPLPLLSPQISPDSDEAEEVPVSGAQKPTLLFSSC